MNLHRPYRNQILLEEFCAEDGYPWPCLTERKTWRCECGGTHPQHGTDRAGRFTCFHSPVCGCGEFRRKEVEQ